MRRMLTTMPIVALALASLPSACADGRDVTAVEELDASEILNAAYSGEMEVTIIDPLTGGQLCTADDLPATASVSGTPPSEITATLDFGTCGGQELPAGTWEPEACVFGSEGDNAGLSCTRFRPGADFGEEIARGFSLRWDGSPNRALMSYSFVVRSSGGDVTTIEAEGTVQR